MLPDFKKYRKWSLQFAQICQYYLHFSILTNHCAIVLFNLIVYLSKLAGGEKIKHHVDYRE